MTKGNFYAICFHLGVIIRSMNDDYKNGILTINQINDLMDKINETEIRYKE
jgi:hypothetical protein